MSLPAPSVDALPATPYRHLTWRPLSRAERRRFARNSIWAFHQDDISKSGSSLTHISLTRTRWQAISRSPRVQDYMAMAHGAGRCMGTVKHKLVVRAKATVRQPRVTTLLPLSLNFRERKDSEILHLLQPTAGSMWLPQLLIKCIPSPLTQRRSSQCSLQSRL